MKTRCLALFLLCAVCLAAGQKEKQSELKQAKVTKQQATAIALARVPQGQVREAELEREHGKLVWSFDIATPNSSDTNVRCAISSMSERLTPKLHGGHGGSRRATEETSRGKPGPDSRGGAPQAPSFPLRDLRVSVASV